ncbi:hypothetical protein ACUN0C_02840 [Faunimonas sp. B44]|uniref:hypothetical protein n=1 Tax=Faunimonas sp. B44 TaxID=3461493 RepID=UPI004044DBE9
MGAQGIRCAASTDKDILMTSISSFLRLAPAPLFQELLARYKIDIPADIDWTAPNATLVRLLRPVINELPPSRRGRLLGAVDRVCAMSKEAGVTSIYSVTSAGHHLDALSSEVGRSLWLYLNRPEEFDHAYGVRQMDHRRGGRNWTAFPGPAGAAIPRTGPAMERFKEEMKAIFDTERVHVDIFDRHRPSFADEDHALIQLAIYREGRPDDLLEFNAEEELQTRSIRPVLEAAMTYEAESGMIEVVGGDRPTRAEVARLFSRELLDHELSRVSLQFRTFDLSVLGSKHGFPTDPEDRIESVHVMLLRLMPLDIAGERITIEAMRGAHGRSGTLQRSGSAPARR